MKRQSRPSAKVVQKPSSTRNANVSTRCESVFRNSLQPKDLQPLGENETMLQFKHFQSQLTLKATHNEPRIVNPRTAPVTTSDKFHRKKLSESIRFGSSTLTQTPPGFRSSTGEEQLPRTLHTHLSTQLTAIEM
jgi:hypothetical protein